jgi:Ran GTPase-activating protein (RanGAP) involved in mRNA processing and transport
MQSLPTVLVARIFSLGSLRLGLRVSHAVRVMIRQHLTALQVNIDGHAKLADLLRQLDFFEGVTRPCTVALRTQMKGFPHANQLFMDISRLVSRNLPPWVERLVCLDVSDSVILSNTTRLLDGLITGAPALREVRVRGCQLGKKGMKALEQALLRHKSVRVLDISQNNLQAEGLLETLCGCRLEELDVSWNRLEVEGMNALVTGLAMSASVHTLRATDMRPTSAAAELWPTAIARLPLRELHLQGSVCGTGPLTKIIDSLPTTLQVLNLSDTFGQCADMGHGLRKVLPRLRLRGLDVSYNDLGGKGVACISEGFVASGDRGLRHLDVSYTRADERGLYRLVSELPKFSALETLQLQGNVAVAENSADDLALWACPGSWQALGRSLHTLDVSNMGMSSTTLRAVAGGLRGAPFLRVLDVGGAKLDFFAAVTLGRAAARMPRLAHLTLNGCETNAEAVRETVRGLHGNKTLRFLGLATCGLGDDGVAALAVALPGLLALELLDLSYNACGEGAAVALYDVLPTCSAAMHVCLLGNELHSAAVMRLGTTFYGRFSDRPVARDKQPGRV